jgi:hypothetical protein
MSKKMMSRLLTLGFTCLAFIGLSESGLPHWEDCSFVSGHPTVVTSDNLDMKAAPSDVI